MTLNDKRKRGFRLTPDDPEIGWTPYAWLIWLVPFALEVFGSEPTPLVTTLAILTMLAFLALYFRGFWVRGRELRFITASIFALGALWSPASPMAFTFYIYAAAFVGQCVRPPRSYLVLAAMALWAAAEGWWLGQNLGLIVPPVLFILIIGGINIHYCELSRRNARTRLAQEEIEQLAIAAERERIGRDLHDLLGQSLSVVSLKAQVARRKLDSEPGSVRRELEEIETTAREALREVRRAVAGYRHAQIGTELVKARVALDSAGIELDVRTSPYDLSPESETIFAMALREATTNIVRHSKAARCRIRSRVEEDEYWLEVEDDGVGIQSPPDSGLRGMRERLEAAGGSLEISPARFASQGTLLRARLPLRRSEPDASSSARELA